MRPAARPRPAPKDRLPPMAPHPDAAHLAAASGGASSSSFASLTGPLRRTVLGSSVSLLHRTDQAASSPSLLGVYWHQMAGVRSYNAGSARWQGGGTWTRAERGSWAVTGTSAETPGPGVYYFDALARERSKHTAARTNARGEPTSTFGVLGHQEDSHLDRLERQHRAQPGPADNTGDPDRPPRVVLAAALNTLRRQLRAARAVLAKRKNGATLTAAEHTVLRGDARPRRLRALRRRARALRDTLAARTEAEVTGVPGRASRLASERKVDRFVDMELVLREKRHMPAPCDYQSVERDFGVDGFSQKISNIPRLLPGHNYKNIYSTPDGAAVLLQRDKSYLDVGPGQYAPTYAPAVAGAVSAPARIPMLNPRSRATDARVQGSTRKLFSNSQLLPSAARPLDSTVATGSTTVVAPRGGEEPAADPHDEIWWSTGPGLTNRGRPYGNYGGGAHKAEEDAPIMGAFIANGRHVRRDGDAENADAPVERFLYAVPNPCRKQREGPEVLPSRLRRRKEADERDRRRQRKARARDVDLVSHL